MGRDEQLGTLGGGPAFLGQFQQQSRVEKVLRLLDADKGSRGRSRYLISIVTGPSAPRDLSSRARPRRSHARRKPDSKQSARNANTSNTVDLPLPCGPEQRGKWSHIPEFHVAQGTKVAHPQALDPCRARRACRIHFCLLL